MDCSDTQEIPRQAEHDEKCFEVWFSVVTLINSLTKNVQNKLLKDCSSSRTSCFAITTKNVIVKDPIDDICDCSNLIEEF